MSVFIAVVVGLLSLVAVAWFTTHFNSNLEWGFVSGSVIAVILRNYFHVGAWTSVLILFTIITLVTASMTYRGNMVKRELLAEMKKNQS